MADSSPLKILAPKRLKLTTDWEKCIVCQSQRNEPLKAATDQSLKTFVNSVTERRDDVFLRLDNHLSDIQSLNVVWHRSCYQTCTSKTHIARSTIKLEADASTSETETKQTGLMRSTAAKSELFDASLCVFCQKTYCKRDKRMHICHIVDKTLQKAVTDLKDEIMLMRLSDNDEKTAGLKYHLACYRDYVYQSSKTNKTIQTDISSETSAEKDIFKKAFDLLRVEVDNDLFTEGKALSMKHLRDRYISLLGENIDTSSYRTEKLQARLKSHYGDRVVIQSQRGRSKSSIIFSSSITVGQAVTAAAALKETVSDMPTYCIIDDNTDSVDTASRETNTLYHSAKLLRSLAQDVKSKTSNSQTISNEYAEDLIPDQLYMFLRWLLEETSNSDLITDQKEKSVRPDIHRLSLSIGQDIIYACNKSVFTPKHIGIGITVKHLTGSKETIKLLNRFGHSISYDEVIRLENSFVQQTKQDQDESIPAIPSNIVAGQFVQAAADNLDFNEQTLDGKNTTHATTLVLYQRTRNGNFGAEVNTKVVKSEKPESKTKLTLEVIEFSRQCRKLKLPDCLMQDEISGETICPSKTAAKCLDMAWVFARLCPSKTFEISLQNREVQIVPAWTAFNTVISSRETPITSIGYCPMLPSSPTEYSTVYTVMKTVQSMMKVLKQKHTVLTFDEAIYCKAKEIQWRCSEEFKDTVIRLGGFHTAMTFIAVIGKRYEESGLEDLLVEAGVYGSGSVMKIMTGKDYNRGVRALKLLMEAFSRLRLQSLAPKINKNTECCAYLDLILTLREAVGKNDEKLCKEILRKIEIHSSAISQELDVLRQTGRDESNTFGFWDEFIAMVEILLRFIRAERDGLWELHIDALSEMIPYFFAYDRINYARWASVYLADMKSLARSAREVYDEFMKGNHPVKRAAGSFNQVWTDLALEQSVNKDSKVKGGIVGSTQNRDTVNRWLLTAHTRAGIVSSTKSMSEDLDRDLRPTPHKETGKSRMERDESDVQKLLDTLNEQMLNPFETSTHKSKCVMNLATGMTSSEEVSKEIITAKDMGQKCYEEFARDRLVTGHEKSVLEPIRKNKLKTLAYYRTQVKVSSEKNTNSKAIDADRRFFSRLIVVAKSRSVDLRAVLEHELSPVPYSLAYPDSTLRKTQKSKLLHMLESGLDTSEALPTANSKYAWIYDGMALVQKTKPTVQSTFGEYAELLLGTILKTFAIETCERVDVVFDRYDNKMSIKTAERSKRQKTQGLHVNIHGQNTQLPKQWSKFLDAPKNKSNLAAFLCNYWSLHATTRIVDGKSLYLAGGFEDGLITKRITSNSTENIPDLYTNQEEADTRMILHAYNAMDECPKITIDSPDTDVLVLCVYYFERLAKVAELYFYTGTGDKRRFIPVHNISRALGSTLSSLLLPFHALTGCDSTSSVCKLGKKKPWNILRDNQTKFLTLSSLGSALDVDSSCSSCTEKFFCMFFGSSQEKINKTRYDMFCKKFTKTENLPPTSDSLSQHVKRANFQALIWKRALDNDAAVENPIGHGWEKDGENIIPTLMTKACAPRSLLVVVSCNCSKSECRGRCSCNKEGLPCIDSCGCAAGDACNNPCKMNEDINDSDEDSDDDGLEHEVED